MVGSHLVRTSTPSAETSKTGKLFNGRIFGGLRLHPPFGIAFTDKGANATGPCHCLPTMDHTNVQPQAQVAFVKMHDFLVIAVFYAIWKYWEYLAIVGFVELSWAQDGKDPFPDLMEAPPAEGGLYLRAGIQGRTPSLGPRPAGPRGTPEW